MTAGSDSSLLAGSVTSHWNENMKVKWNIQWSVMSSQWDGPCKECKPVGSSRDFERRHLQRCDDVLPCDHTHSIKKNGEVLWNHLDAEVIIWLVETEEYGKINAPSGCNHKHDDIAKAKEPFCLETSVITQRVSNVTQNMSALYNGEASLQRFIVLSPKLLCCSNSGSCLL